MQVVISVLHTKLLINEYIWENREHLQTLAFDWQTGWQPYISVQVPFIRQNQWYFYKNMLQVLYAYYKTLACQ